MATGTDRIPNFTPATNNTSLYIAYSVMLFILILRQGIDKLSIMVTMIVVLYITVTFPPWDYDCMRFVCFISYKREKR